MIRRSYGTVEQTEASKNLAKEVTSLIVSSNVTYMEAQNALELVLETLENKASYCPRSCARRFKIDVLSKSISSSNSFCIGAGRDFTKSAVLSR